MKIQILKSEKCGKKNAIILAYYYVSVEIQDFANY